MPIEKVSNILKVADNNGYAVPAFTVFNYENIAWAIEAAEEAGSPVIAMFYPGMDFYIPFSTLAAITRDLGSRAKVPVGIHLDHSTSFEEIMRSIKDGFRTVMFDGSALDFEENTRITSLVVKAAHAMDIDVEAELGHVGSAANLNDFTNTDNFTKVSEAVSFVEQTGVDCLAVSIGSAHGNYVATPKLDLKRLGEINKAVDIPLVLHGGTGIPDDQIREAVKLGITKLNIGTEYNQKFYSTIKSIMDEQKSGANMFDCLLKAKVDVKDYLHAKINLLRP